MAIDDNDTPNTGAADLLRARLAADPEAAALLDQALASRPSTSARPAAPAPSGARSYTIDEIRDIAGALGRPVPGQPATPTTVSSAPPVVPVTSRAPSPPPAVPTEDTPILSMSEADQRALAKKMGDVEFARRFERELVRDRVKVRTGRLA
jgi:hypothetical protein